MEVSIKCNAADKGSSVQERHGGQKNRQKGKADPRKKQEEVLSTIRNMVCIFPKGNEACQRSYQRSCAAHIDANQKPAGISREAAEQNSGRNIADDLAGKRRNQNSSVGQKAGEQYPNSFHSSKVAGKGEKSGESGQQSPVYCFQRMPIQQPERQDDDSQTKNIGYQPQYHGNG